MIKIREQKTLNLKRYDAVFPEPFLNEFERRFVQSVREEGPNTEERRKRARLVWSAAKKMIIAVQLDPADWYYSLLSINDYFHRQAFSIRYINTIIKWANLWGHFFCRKLGRSFMSIPLPKGYERERFISSYYQSTRNGSRPSRPLSPAAINKLSGRLNVENFNWLYLTAWLGSYAVRFKDSAN